MGLDALTQTAAQAKPQLSSFVNSPAFVPLMGAGLGMLAGGPRGAVRGGLLGGTEMGLAATGNPALMMMGPMTLQALGLL